MGTFSAVVRTEFAYEHLHCHLVHTSVWVIVDVYAIVSQETCHCGDGQVKFFGKSAQFLS